MAALSEEKKLEISGFFLVLLALFPLLRPALQSVFLILFSLASLVLYRKSLFNEIKNKKRLTLFLIFIGYYIWHIITLLWSSNKLEGLQTLQSNLLLLVFPILFIFFHPNPSSKIILRVQLVFISAMLIYIVFWYNHYVTGVSYYQNLKLNEIPLNKSSFLDQVHFFLNKNYYWISGSSIRGYRMAGETPKLFLHHGYISAYFLLAMLFSLQLAIKNKSKLAKGGFILSTLFFISFIVYLPSAINKLAMLVATPIIVFQHISRKKIVLLVLLFGLGGIYFTSKNWENIKRIKLIEKENLISFDPTIIDYFRYHTYSCAIEKIPNNFFYGMGVGDVQPYLNECLPEEDWPGLSDTRRIINTHSQFLHYLLTGGIIGLVLFLFLWCKLFLWGWQQHNALLLIVLLIVVMNCFFENFLSRIWGAFFFVYFTFLFLKIPASNEQAQSSLE